MKKIYVTHCSAKKDPTLLETNHLVTPDKLYTARPTQRFMNQCKKRNVDWAIFSDKYGVWFPIEKHVWYEKDPNTVTQKEFDILVKDFEDKLKNYDTIYFYYNPGRFHPLYKKLLDVVNIRDKIVLITHIREIVHGSDTYY